MKKSYWWQGKKSGVHCYELKVQKIECKSINIVWKQDETTTKSMNALHRFLKKAQKERFAWAIFKIFKQNSVKEFSSTEMLKS